jgi:glycine/D-amino acid oxidase-like deaminating enzyme
VRSSAAYDAIVIGAGIFGSTIALALNERFPRVALLEHEADVLCRASYTNQARVHRGYHYPRSLLTALRSRVNFPRFAADFSDCIDRSFDSYYAVARSLSKMTATQFRVFCHRIGAELEPAPKQIRALFDRHLVEDVYQAREYVFDAVKMRRKLRGVLSASTIDLRLGCRATRIEEDGSHLRVTCMTGADASSVTAVRVISCTYSQLNQILADSGLPLVSLKHELTELALVEVPDEFRSIGITLMDGPFFSIMPFPPRGLHTLSHVRYTPHHTWEDRPGMDYKNGDAVLLGYSRHSRYPHMIRDAQRYVPALRQCRHVDSMWEVKTVLPRSEVDDSRPIFVRRHHGLRNLTGVLGGKVDNVYDIIDELEASEVRGTGLESI